MPGQAELRRQKVKDLSSAIVALDELVGFNKRVSEGNARVSGVLSKFKDKEEIKRKKFGGGT
jgi:predicted transcriptional regulator